MSCRWINRSNLPDYCSTCVFHTLPTACTRDQSAPELPRSYRLTRSMSEETRRKIKQTLIRRYHPRARLQDAKITG